MNKLQKQGQRSVDEQANKDVREGEKNKFWFRSERFFMVEGQWYFTIRECEDIGPFGSLEEVKHAHSLFVDCVFHQGTSIEHAISVAKQGDWAIVGFH